MRLFVAAWPPPELVAALSAMHRPPSPAVRWTAPEQWHVTLRFLGVVADEEVVAVGDALAGGLAGTDPVTAEAGPAVERLGRGVACVPVRGLDGLAGAVEEATAVFGQSPDHRPFHGHLTVARARGRRDRLPAEAVGQPVAGRWTVTGVDLVASHPHSSGHRYWVTRPVPLPP